MVKVRFTRQKNMITDLGDDKKHINCDSINEAKRESRKIQKLHGLGSLILIK